MRSLPLLTACLLLLAAVARADDLPSDAAGLAAKIAELRKAEDAAALSAAVKKAPDAHKAATDPAQKTALEAELGKVLKDKKAGDDARVTAAESLALLEDKKAAWKQLSGAMPDPKGEEATDVDTAVLKAAGEVADDRAIAPLLELVQKAKANANARDAAEALGAFGSDKKKRVMVLEELISIGQRLMPSSGGGSGKQVSKEAQERWGEVGGGIIRGLNKLTGQNVQAFPDWVALYQDHKKSPARLFKGE